MSDIKKELKERQDILTSIHSFRLAREHVLCTHCGKKAVHIAGAKFKHPGRVGKPFIPTRYCGER